MCYQIYQLYAGESEMLSMKFDFELVAFSSWANMLLLGHKLILVIIVFVDFSSLLVYSHTCLKRHLY